MDYANFPIEEERASKNAGDRWALLPAVATTLAVTVLMFFCGLPGELSFVLIPITVLTFVAAPFVILGAAFVLAIRKRPRRAASALLVLGIPVLLWGPITWTAESLHLGITAAFGAGRLGSSSNGNPSAFTAYDWSTGLAGGPSTFLIHDVTDEIALPLAKHRQPAAAAENGFGEECAGRVRHLLGHYYVCTF